MAGLGRPQVTCKTPGHMLPVQNNQVHLHLGVQANGHAELLHALQKDAQLTGESRYA